MAQGTRPLGLPPLDLSPAPSAQRPLLEARVAAAEAAGHHSIVAARTIGAADDPEQVWCVSSVDGAFGPTRTACVDAELRVSALDEAWKRYHDARWARDGAMTPGLAERVRAALLTGGSAAELPLPVFAWARQPAELFDAVRPADPAFQQAAWSRAVGAMLADCEAAAAEEGERCETAPIDDAPFAMIKAPPRTLQRWAWKPTVGALQFEAPEAGQGTPQANGNDFLLSGRFNVAQGYAPPIDGDGATVAILEGGRLRLGAEGAFAGWLDTANDVLCTTGPRGFHADGVASVLASNSSFGTATGGRRSLNGAAPGARLVLANYGNILGGSIGHCASSALVPGCNPTCGYQAAVANAYSWSVNTKLADVLQDALVWPDPNPYTWIDRYIDWRGNNGTYPTIVTVAGQTGCAGGLAWHACYNCLVAGASDDQDDSNRSNDVVGAICGNNRPDGLEVPHVAGVGNRMKILGGFGPGAPANDWAISPPGSISTSWASPEISGLAASLIGDDGSLRYYPEAIRAMIMATATKDTDGNALVIGDAIDDADGAGLINAGIAARLVRSGARNLWNNATGSSAGVNYGSLNQSTSFDGNGYYNGYVLLRPSAGQSRAQVTLTWNVFTTCAGVSGNPQCPVVSTPSSIGAYSVEVYDASFNLIATSQVSQMHHNYVHVRFPVSSASNYYLFMKRTWLNPSPPGGWQYFGLAWTTFTTAEE